MADERLNSSEEGEVPESTKQLAQMSIQVKQMSMILDQVAANSKKSKRNSAPHRPVNGIDNSAEVDACPSRTATNTASPAFSTTRNIIVRADEYLELKRNNAILRSHNISIFKQRNCLQVENDRLQQLVEELTSEPGEKRSEAKHKK